VSVALVMITRYSIADLFARVLSADIIKLVILVSDFNTSKTRKAVRQFTEAHSKELIVERSRLPLGWSRPIHATAKQTAVDICL